MTRSEFDDIRAHIAAEADHPTDLLRIAHTLLDDLEQARLRETTLRTYYLGLLTAARAAVAAERAGDPAPLTFVEHELDKRGQLPAGDEDVMRILADARATTALLAAMDTKSSPRRRRTGPISRLRRCGGTTRPLHH